ncbi:1-aminocyclopropane-1-carboxylate oxidase-like [Pistacia vera]|uniref:1-aminocyclopropane-1-carboxylate oxidase-like n=1 Tax=Pistacia vera TaxID=55513 RepID=UPI001262D40E|nr:1-aminocyclopropane-1-carboxylate oxidase-like [Pistacia vera]
MAAVSPQSVPEKPLDFRAPPPSPIASSRRSSVTNDDVLTEYLEHSLRVPDLILPDKVFPRQKFIENPPRIDFQTLNSEESCDSVSKIVDSITTIGCFQLVNYGIPSELIKSALAIAAGVFRVSPEKRATVTRSPEKPYGFEEVHGEEESEMSEEFVWCRDENLKLEMEGIWPLGYSKFSEKMETLLGDIEKLGEKILVSLRENCVRKSMHGDEILEEHENVGSVCHIHKHSHNILADFSSLRYDVIRMLIRGVDYSHALCLHICDGASEFHVYSKKGWVSFCPDKDAILITAGDQIQAVSGGQYKHVIGRPVYKEEKGDCISMAFLYAPQTIITNFTPNLEKEKTISLPQQFIVALLLTLLYHFLVFVYKKF